MLSFWNESVTKPTVGATPLPPYTINKYQYTPPGFNLFKMVVLPLLSNPNKRMLTVGPDIPNAFFNESQIPILF